MTKTKELCVNGNFGTDWKFPVISPANTALRVLLLLPFCSAYINSRTITKLELDYAVFNKIIMQLAKKYPISQLSVTYFFMVVISKL